MYEILPTEKVEDDSNDFTSQVSEEEDSSSDDRTNKTDNEEDQQVADIFTDLLSVILLKKNQRISKPRIKRNDDIVNQSV